MSSFISHFIHLLNTATRYEVTLFAVEHTTYTYLYASRSLDELSLDVLWDESLAPALPWQPLRLLGIAAQQFWQVLELAGHLRLDYGAASMPEADLSLTRLTAAARFRKQRGLGERGRWATLTGVDLEAVQDLLAAYPSDSQIFSSLLTEIDLSELGTLACQLAQWQNDSLEAELAAATQWVQQEQATFLPSAVALSALGCFTWRDGVMVEQLDSTHVRPRQWQAVLVWLPVNPEEPISLQLQFYDARQPQHALAAGHTQATTEAFCQAFGYATLACRAENRAWLTATGRQQMDESGKSLWVIEAWQLAALSLTSIQYTEYA